jgi:hypothetical protein
MYTCILNSALVNMSQFVVGPNAHLDPLRPRFCTPAENSLDSWFSVFLLLQHWSSPCCQLSKRRFVGAPCGGIGADEETIDYKTPNRHTLSGRLHGVILSAVLCTLPGRSGEFGRSGKRGDFASPLSSLRRRVSQVVSKTTCRATEVWKVV